MTDNNEIKRWTAKRKVALAKELIRGQTTVSEAAREHDLKPSECNHPIFNGAYS